MAINILRNLLSSFEERKETIKLLSLLTKELSGTEKILCTVILESLKKEQTEDNKNLHLLYDIHENNRMVPFSKVKI